MNSPDISEQIVDEALRLGIKRVWMHSNGMAPSSVSEAAVARCKAEGANVISAGCPMMFLEPDAFHKCMRWMLRVRGRLN
jgi:predicted CoA-binding protein